MNEARARVVAYLDEIDRVNKANDYGRSSYADAVHGINDNELRRSDLRSILSGPAEELRESADILETLAGSATWQDVAAHLRRRADAIE